MRSSQLPDRNAVAAAKLAVSVVVIKPLGLIYHKFSSSSFGPCHKGCVLRPNDQKLSDRSPEARVCAERREAKARHVLGFMAGAHAVTEPVERPPALR